MDNYQKHLIETFSNFRPSPKYPTYPPYHEGLYLEDYFFNWFVFRLLDLSRSHVLETVQNQSQTCTTGTRPHETYGRY